MKLDCAGKSLDLSRTVIMGVLNVTPDSFSDGGQFIELDRACRQAEKMILSGAGIIDIGGESTRPGAQQISIQQESERVMPVLERLTREFDCVISVDTSKPPIMAQAVAAGAGMINDICALRSRDARRTVSQSGAAVCLMHMQGEPGTMQISPQYEDVVNEVKSFLLERAEQCMTDGVDSKQIVIDPGFGFGKSVEHNIRLLDNLNQLSQSGFPVLAGLSRKSMIGHLLGLPVDQRAAPSIALAVKAVQNGAKIIRAHDVKYTHDAIRMIEAIERVSKIDE